MRRGVVLCYCYHNILAKELSCCSTVWGGTPMRWTLCYISSLSTVFIMWCDYFSMCSLQVYVTSHCMNLFCIMKVLCYSSYADISRSSLLDCRSMCCSIIEALPHKLAGRYSVAVSKSDSKLRNIEYSKRNNIPLVFILTLPFGNHDDAVSEPHRRLFIRTSGTSRRFYSHCLISDTKTLTR
jgi:hypothetical protein